MADDHTFVADLWFRIDVTMKAMNAEAEAEGEDEDEDFGGETFEYEVVKKAVAIVQSQRF